MDKHPWIGWQGVIAHPASPAGGGGPGRFRIPTPLNNGVTLSNIGSLDSPPNLLELWNAFKALGISAESVLEDLTRVDWLGTFDTAGLEGDWHKLYVIWFFELSPASVGTWSVEGGVPLVTITSKGYVNDLKKKPNYQESLNLFKQKYPDLKAIKVGSLITNNFTFTGEGSASGKYSALEWFMGSYQTMITATSNSQTTKSVTVKVEVSNTSHWQSGTRLPRSFINKGLPPYLVRDAPRTAFGPGGTFKQKFIWNDTIQYD
jgi:hypothetical protein